MVWDVSAFAVFLVGDAAGAERGGEPREDGIGAPGSVGTRGTQVVRSPPNGAWEGSTTLGMTSSSLTGTPASAKKSSPRCPSEGRHEGRQLTASYTISGPKGTSMSPEP